MSTLSSYEDYRNLGFSPFLRRPGGMDQVRSFVHAQLEETLQDPDQYFPFAAILAGYIRGKNLEDVPPDLRGTVRRESIDAFWEMLPDLKRVALASRLNKITWPKDTRLAVLRALFQGLPAAILEQSTTTTDRRALEMVDVWLISHAILRSCQDQPEAVVRLTARGLLRWRSARLTTELLAGTKFDSFLKGLTEEEQQAFPEIDRLDVALESVADRPGAVMVRSLMTDPVEQQAGTKRWAAISQAIRDQPDSLRDLIERRARGIPPDDAVPRAEAALLWGTVQEWFR